MLNVVAVGSLVASLLAPASMPTSAEEVAAPDGVSVEVVTVNGSGCPAGRGSAVLSADRTSVVITSPAYVAWAGDGAGPTDFRRNCQVNLRVSRPQGATYAVAQVTSSGYVHLAAGATGVSRVSLYFQGMSQTTVFTHAFAGRVSDTWVTEDVADGASLVYSPCDAERNLNVNTELRVNRGTSDPSATSFMVRDPVTTLQLVWRRCAAG